MMKIEEIQSLTEKWGKDRLITINGKIPTQTLKYGEEMAELFEAKEPIEVVDSIGDQVVVLSMIANLNGTSALTCMNENSTIEKSYSYGADDLIIYYGKLCRAVVREDHGKLNEIVGNLMMTLRSLANNTAESSLTQCWLFAYNEIKDRKGKLLANGNFVKEEYCGNNPK